MDKELELNIFIRFNGDSRIEVVENHSDVYSETVLSEMIEEMGTIQYNVQEFIKLDIFSKEVKEIYGEIILRTEDADEVDVLEQFSEVLL